MENKKVLVAYFSRSGNSRRAAETAAGLTGGMLYEIKREKPYKEEYKACVLEAVAEKAIHARPALAEPLPDLTGVETLILGYPNWCGGCPMPVLSFLEQGGFAGKTILPYCTNGGSGLGSGPKEIAAACPKATVGEGLSLFDGAAATAAGALKNWLAGAGLAEKS